jgi:beta-ribofuranosylaminobenzene 5'-phosphate synthase
MTFKDASTCGGISGKMKVITVKTTARLHMGIIDVNGGLGRIYGSLGLAIQKPNVILEASESNSLHVEGLDVTRVKDAANTFLQHFNIDRSCRIKVKSTIPSHIGLGSGTQLRLAVAKSLATLYQIDASTRELAGIVGRGTVSGIGTAAFDHGGFNIDGGVPAKEENRRLPAPIIFSQVFPDNWFLVVAVPSASKGYSGPIEDRAFADLPSAQPELVGRMCRLLVMKLLPALAERDIVNFGSALTELQRLTGECFSSIQGGQFAGTTISETVNFMLNKDAYGAGQSSWGPTVYGLVEGRSAAESLTKQVQTFLDASAGGRVFYTTGNNNGAEIKVSEDI